MTRGDVRGGAASPDEKLLYSNARAPAIPPVRSRNTNPLPSPCPPALPSGRDAVSDGGGTGSGAAAGSALGGESVCAGEGASPWTLRRSKETSSAPGFELAPRNAGALTG